MATTRAFQVHVSSNVSADAIYGVLSDLTTHLVWGGDQVPDQRFRLLTMDRASAPATVGTAWESTGGNGPLGTFHDRSTVVVADPGRAFGFNTEATLERKRARPWQCYVEHRYTIQPSEAGSTLTYHFEVRPKNYRPFWLRGMFWPIARASVSRTVRKNLENLTRLAGEQEKSPRADT